MIILQNILLHKNGINVQYSFNTNGIVISISCYSDILGKVIDKIITNFIDIKRMDNNYNTFFDYYERTQFSSDAKAKQLNQVMLLLQNFITNGIIGSLINEQKNQIYLYSYDKLISLLNNLLTRVSPFTFTIIGDINKNEIQNISNNIKNIIKHLKFFKCLMLNH